MRRVNIKKEHRRQEKKCPDGLTVAIIVNPGSLLPEALDEFPNEPNLHL